MTPIPIVYQSGFTMETSEKESQLFTKPKAAEYLGISVERLNILILEQRIRFIQIGKRQYIPISELQRFIVDNLTHLEREEINETNNIDLHSLREDHLNNIKRKDSLDIFEQIMENTNNGISL